jgi:type I restriction enzyme S subunit
MKKGWHIKKIGEVCDLMTGGTPPRSKAEYFGGDIKWLVSGDIHRGEIFDCEGRITEAGMQASNAKQLPVNSVMIALNGQGKTRGTVAILRTQATCNQSLVSIYPKEPGKLLPEFLYANLHGRYQEIRQMTGDSGNDRRGLNMGLIRQMEIPLAPVDEQQRIVGILDEAFDGIATATANSEKNLQNARALFESYLQSIFVRHGKDWMQKRLGVVAEFKNGLNYTRGSNGQTLPVVGVGDFQSNNFVPLEHLQTATIDGELRSEYTIREGDILTVRSNGSKDLVGRCMIVPEVSRTTSYSGFIIRIRVNPAEVFPAFLLHFMKSRDTRDRLTRDGGGANINNINQTKLAALPLSLPSLAEQKKIVTELEAFTAETQRLEGIYQQKLAALGELKKTLLHEAFTGNL